MADYVSVSLSLPSSLSLFLSLSLSLSHRVGGRGGSYTGGRVVTSRPMSAMAEPQMWEEPEADSGASGTSDAASGTPTGTSDAASGTSGAQSGAASGASGAAPGASWNNGQATTPFPPPPAAAPTVVVINQGAQDTNQRQPEQKVGKGETDGI